MTTLPAEEITFYVPARNAGATLRPCLESIFGQTLVPAEIIVVADTASEDDTVAIAHDFPGVHVIEHANGKLGWVRNQAIAQASTDWLACSDADVILNNDWLERLAASPNTDTAVIGGCVEERISTPFDQWRAVACPHNWGDHAFRNPYMLVGNALYDRRALLSIGGYQEHLGPYDDSDLCLRLRDAGFELAYEPAARAMHLRKDSLRSVLDMRWHYVRFRQAQAFERLTGLIEKLPRNREFALHSLGKVLAAGQETTAYVSFLLFYHHALCDLRELLRRRPLVPACERQACEQQLLGGMLASLGQVDDRLATLVAEDLAGSAPDPEAGGHLLGSPPKWADYLRTAERASADFADELAHDLRAMIQASGEFLHDRARPEQVPLLPRAESAQTQAILDHLTYEPLLDEATCVRWREQLGGGSTLWLVGPAAESDRELLSRHFDVQRSTAAELDGSVSGTVIALHLEADARPLETLDALIRQADRLIVAYTPPELFIPSLEPLGARDLAGAAAKGDLEIVAFDTFVGSTTLVLKRTASHQPTHESTETAVAAPA